MTSPFICKIMRMLLNRFIFCLLVYNGRGSTIDPGVLSDQMKFCLEGGQFLHMMTFKCFTPLEQGICKENEWFVQTVNTGFGDCAERKCENSTVYFKPEGQCVDADYSQFVCQNEGRGKSLYVNFQGESVCRCTDNWTKGLGRDCDLFFTQGVCSPGKYIFPRITALEIGADVECDRGFFCSTSNQCPEYNFFKKQLEEIYEHQDLRCRLNGRDGQCCPNSDYKDNLETYYLDRLARADDVDEGVCVENPCPSGQSVFLKDGQWKCFKADSKVYNCKGHLQIDSEGLYCLDDGTIQPFSINTRPKRSCRRGFYYSRFRGRCIRAGRRK